MHRCLQLCQTGSRVNAMNGSNILFNTRNNFRILRHPDIGLTQAELTKVETAPLR